MLCITANNIFNSFSHNKRKFQNDIHTEEVVPRSVDLKNNCYIFIRSTKKYNQYRAHGAHQITCSSVHHRH